MICIKSQHRHNHPIWFTIIKIILTTLLCTLVAYIICSYAVEPKYQTRAYFRVGYNHLPEDFYEQIIDENPVNLVQELRDIIRGDDTYRLAASYSFVDAETVEQSISVSNAYHIGHEWLVITCTGPQAHQVHAVTNAYLRALDEVLTYGPGPSMIYNSGNSQIVSTNKITPAPFPNAQSTVQVTPILITTAVLSFTLAYLIFSKKTLFDAITQLIFVLFIFICVFPFYYLLINSVSENTLAESGKILLLPHKVHLENYKALFSNSTLEIAKSINVTFWRTVLGTGLMVCTSAWAGYLFSHKNLWGRRFWYCFVMFTLFFQAGIVPWVMNMRMLGLENNFLAYILPGMVAPCCILLMTNHIETIPHPVREAALVDGAGTFRYFISIVVPMCAPLLFAIAIWGAFSHWNAFIDSLLLMNENSGLQTISHKLYLNIVHLMEHSSSGSTSTGTVAQEKLVTYTLAVIICLPVFVLYPFLHKYFINGITPGVVKH